MDLSQDVVVCSFYTADDYYRDHAQTLRQNLERLDVHHELAEIEKQPGEEWPDICRKKVPFLADVCDKYPDRKVFWIDVDCQLLDLPANIAGFSADLIGFQRGFGSPLNIGYSVRSRFWEPCFFGINTTAGGRRFIGDARRLEADVDVRATDDYFFEESWRANAHRLSFQVIPSAAMVSKALDPAEGVTPFFSFGASGNVAEYKDKVVQHRPLGGGRSGAAARKVRTTALRGGKALERRLPDSTAQRLRRLADTSGLTHLITGGGADAGGGFALGAGSPHRARIVGQMMVAAQSGDTAASNEAFVRLTSSSIPSTAEILAKQAADSFGSYARPVEGASPIALAWWPRPFPGNFGDWLSPFVLASVSGAPVSYVSPTARSSSPHIVAVGSIGRFVKRNSIVVGTGISNDDIMLEKAARYISVRGPLTARLLADCGGPRVECLGDPGALLSRLVPVESTEPNGRLALVRHFTHRHIPLTVPDDMDELDVLVSHPDAIRSFVERLHEYDGVVTSAMHVMIACQSYGIPCALIGFEGFETTVHGNGIKYEDYALGAGLDTVNTPQTVGFDLRGASLRDRLTEVRVSEEKLDEIDDAVRAAIDSYLDTAAATVPAASRS